MEVIQANSNKEYNFVKVIRKNDRDLSRPIGRKDQNFLSRLTGRRYRNLSTPKVRRYQNFFDQ
jgi:hypothetical protein